MCVSVFGLAYYFREEQNENETGKSKTNMIKLIETPSELTNNNNMISNKLKLSAGISFTE